MILSGKSIVKKLDYGRLTIDPAPDADQIQPASLDVRMGKYGLRDPEDNERLYTETARPFTRYHAYTHERIGLPDDMAAFLTGRSTYGRKGVTMHVTAGWIDPGFEGRLLFEIVNLSRNEVALPPYGRVAQLVFFPTDQPTSGYDGQYQGQEAPDDG